MTTDIQGVVIAGVFTLLGVGITVSATLIQTNADLRKFKERLRYEASEKRKERIVEDRSRYLTVLRQTMAELLQIDREGSMARFATQEFISSNNKRSDKVNADLRKCLDQNRDNALDLLVKDVIDISAELFSFGQDMTSSVSAGRTEFSERLNRRKQLSEQLHSKKLLVNARIEQLLCGDD